MWELWQTVNITLAVLFFIQSLYCGYQMWKIYSYGHRMASFQNYFLLMSLTETVMRFVFFIIYGQSWAPDLPMISWTIIYWTPLHIQFAMFSLIVLFFAKMVHKQEWEERGNYFLGSWVALNLFLLLGLMGWIVPSTKHHFKHDVINDPNMARACVAALLFFVLSMLLIKYGLTLARMITDSRVQLLATELTGLQIRTLTIVLSSLFTLRSTFNVLAAATGKFSLRMAGETNQEAVLLFLMVVAWELVPIFAVTFFFRHIPNPNQPRGGNNRSDRGPLLPPNMSIPNYTPGLFQNPNHYDNPTLPFDESRTMGRGITALPALDNARFVVPSPRNSGSPRQQNFRFATQTVQGSHPPRVPSPSEGMMTSPTRNTAYRFSSNTRDSPTYPRLSNDPSATILPAQPS